MKENANPTIYKISKKGAREGNASRNTLVATPFLKRLDCELASEFDSPFHHDPSQILTPTERSIQCALSSIDESSRRSHEGKGKPLGLLHEAGIRTTYGNASQSKGGSNIFVDTRSLHPFKPISTPLDDNSEPSDGSKRNRRGPPLNNEWDGRRDPITNEEIFDIIRNIQDPEHPLTLEQLNVVNLDHVQVHDHLSSNTDANAHKHSTIDVKFTPTIPHCSMATLIGLCIRVKLLRSTPSRFKINVVINPGTHASEFAINRQLNDKERVIAALENVHLCKVVNKCIKNGMLDGQ